ncbi:MULTISPECIES: hypothetical protein [unclassified Thomasclavelia]|uniref:Uncharacterized protein n=1 Tax=Candidatus Erysipelatoclostridium merdavium TaxID=2838566 RepID=A0A9D1XMM0_9FIRM|nr:MULTISPECIES: hypothetical protein [unclassified Thomasclavelia]HIX82149.1 hypothetical protein [Candidatus Erysipelatoclostridium merdavium]
MNMPLTDDDFLKDSKLELYNEVIESLQEQEEKVEEIDYQLDLSEDDE